MFYSIREGFAGLIRAKVASTITITVISLSLVLVGFFLIFIFNATRLVDTIQNRIELEVFIDNSFTPEQTEVLRNSINYMAGVLQVTYVSKEQAMEIYKKFFNEDDFEILDENPLPASFQIKLIKEYRNSKMANQIIQQIAQLDGVDDIEFRNDILVTIEKYMDYLMIGILTAGNLLLIGAVALVSNTIKLVILSRIRIIETMRLVGATKGFIRRPFIFEGIFQGVFGAILSILFFYITVKIIDVEIPGIIVVNSYIYLMLFGLGLFLGAIGSILAMQRFLKF
ncbi:ABC transporter permease [candidate division KSB1 bacterium]|nr:ABC transporter permease [candidate division KSB1 bacterium]